MPEGVDDTGINDASTIDRFGVSELATMLDKLAPHMHEDVPKDYVIPWAEMQTSLTNDLRDAQAAGDPVAVDRALKWLLVSHALVLRGRTRGRSRRRFRDTVATRFSLWREGDLHKLLDLCVAEAERVPPRCHRELSVPQRTFA